MKAEEVLLVADDAVLSSFYQCRICHEEEEESSKTMEAPCACSGSLKFAHRKCIQRWCDEKGNTTCEICLQQFEPGYTAPPPPNKTRLADVAVTIRGSLEVNPETYDRRFPVQPAHALVADDYAECAAAAERSTSFCRFVALMLTILLLVRHLIAVLHEEGEHYELAVFTLLILRAGGIVLPLYIIMRTIEAIRLRQLQQWHHDIDSSLFEGEDQRSHHTIQIE